MKDKVVGVVNFGVPCGKFFLLVATEAELKELKQQQLAESKKRQRKNDDNLILNFANDKYQLPPEFKPNFEYIFTKHQFETEKLALLVKKNFK